MTLTRWSVPRKTNCPPGVRKGSIMVTMEIGNVYLSSSVKVADYLKFEKDKKKEKIACFIQERFTERYITPLRGCNKHGCECNTHGFSIMAVSCLMIETLESFWQGWPDADGKSKKAFKCFFKRCLDRGSRLGEFNEIATEFYTDVRCGILHQAETKGGWRIRRDGDLYNKTEKTINATKFLNELESALKIYCEELKTSKWDADVWCKLRKKMCEVIKNCIPTS